MNQSWTIPTIVEFLTAKGIKQGDIAKKIGVAGATLSRIVNGKQEETKGILNKLLMAFHDELNGIDKPKAADPTGDEKALIKALLFEVVNLKAAQEKISFEEALEGIRKNTNLVKAFDFGL